MEDILEHGIYDVENSVYIINNVWFSKSLEDPTHRPPTDIPIPRNELADIITYIIRW
jgi:hypothetical protein